MGVVIEAGGDAWLGLGFMGDDGEADGGDGGWR